MPSHAPANTQARRDLEIVTREARQMAAIRRLHGTAPLLWIWGLALSIGNAGYAYLGHTRYLPLWWLGVIVSAAGLSAVLEWRQRLRTIEAWRMHGLTGILVLQGWIVYLMMGDAWTLRIGAAYVSGLILLGWTLTTLLLKAPGWFALSSVFLILVYAGYFLFSTPEALCWYLSAGVGGCMCLTALATTLVQWRLMHPSRRKTETS